MPQLEVATYSSQIFWLILTFIAMYFVVARIGLPRISDILQTRQDRISGDLDKAEKYKKEAEKIEAEYRKDLEKTRSKAFAIIADANAQMDKLAKEKHAELDKMLVSKAVEAEQKIEDARKKAIEEIRFVASGLVQSVVMQVAGIKISKERAESKIKDLMGAI